MAVPAQDPFQQHPLVQSQQSRSYEPGPRPQSLPSQALSPETGPLGTSSSQSGSRTNPQFPHVLQMSPASTMPQGGYYAPYTPTSTSSGSGPPPFHDPSTPRHSSIATPGGSASHLSSAGLQAQKRAYRQRRKDPSCDACRERKVKCDATETTSCSECSSRNVKCQFTKETNRRMSSIKQVQDLEKQLAHARQQLSHLRPLVKDGSPQDMDGEPAQQPTVRLPEVGSHPRRRQRPPVTKDLTRVRANLRNYGRGIFKPPPPYRQAGSPPLFSPPLPDLPVKATADHILGQYRSSVHVVIPILHWPTFHQTYESVYHHGTLRNVPPIWSSLLFAVLACGVLNIDNRSIDQAREGKAYIETSLRLTDLWNDEFTVDHARSALLTSIFLAEMNLRSAAWTWLGSSIRISQDIGLHCETGPWPVTEGEMRRRVWWGIYAWDRLLSTELGRPLQIDDNDCDVGLPCPVDDQYVRDEGILVPTDSPAAENFLVTTIHIVRFISPLAKALKSPVIANPTLNTFDTHFSACMAAFPPQCQIHSAQPLDPQSLAPICYLQNARLILHRHNLSTSCSQEVRSAAIDHCVAAARDTVHLLSRSMRDPAQGSDRSTKAPDWSARLASVASAMLCTHLWRCTLFLCFRGYYSEALTCVQACAAIGELRVVNQACGRNLAFFLHTLVEKLQRGEGHNLEQDEEMMVYVSGDVQGSTENSWVWQGSATGMELNHLERGVYPGSEVEMARALDQHSHAPRLSTTELQEWGGWPQIEWLLRALLREQEDSSPSQAQLSAPPGALAQPQPSAQSSSRISIANII